MQEILVRVIPEPGREGELGGASFYERFEDRVDELGSNLGGIAQRLRGRLDAELTPEASAAWDLDKVELTFSLDLEAEAGVVLAKAKSSAGFQVSLGWSRRTGTVE